ncbi:unnamed protein product [Protopolystoma xenopodis]|uniref:Vps72/YL1 C-terminal domain-containing protein n=1 Tax=Protopolystoma xenopodis TaxID=117903 RepID=A0A448X1B0_9PLAT|nr:unnamed protein product [Protopolystoma xenopodis]
MIGPQTTVRYHQIDAPPSTKPTLKVSDLSGTPTSYRDPKTSLRFATIEEFQKIRIFPHHIINGYLALRGSNIDSFLV